MSCKTYIEIKADTNDGDYVLERTLIKESDLVKIGKIAKAIKNCKISHNWAVGEYMDDDESPEIVYAGILTEDEIEWFDNFVPHGEYGIHSIEHIKILEVLTETNLL